MRLERNVANWEREFWYQREGSHYWKPDTEPVARQLLTNCVCPKEA